MLRKFFPFILSSAALIVFMTAMTAHSDQTPPLFDFHTTDSARSAWEPAPWASPVALFPGIPEKEGPGLTFPCAFTAQATRCYWDYAVDLDLSAESVMYLRMYVDSLDTVGNITLYFRSGSGWYGGWFVPARAGWQTIRLNRASFSVEGTPAGWDRIDAIRFSCWRRADGEALVHLTELKAVSARIVVIRGTRNAEPATALQTAALFENILESYGIPFTSISDEDAEEGLPANAELAILPYNSPMSEAEMASLEAFSATGGKLLLFYNAPQRLAGLVGAQLTGWAQRQLTGMSFVTGIVPCIPETAAQASWNLMLSHTTGSGAMILARWRDAGGSVTNTPAWIINDKGAYMSHILLDDDMSAKERVIISLAAHFVPGVSSSLSQYILDRAGMVGPYNDFLDAADAIRGEGDRTSRKALVREQLDLALDAWTRANDIPTTAGFCAVWDLASTAEAALKEAFYLSQSPREPEFRALWEHFGTGAYPGDWERTAEALARNGINAIIPNMLWGGLAHYASDLLPRSGTFNTYGDQIQACVDACVPRGIEVHVWKVNWNLSGAPASFVQSMREQNRTQVNASGEDMDWLCPSHPDNQKLELDTLVEVAERYNVQGIHFDYIRYPDAQTCYCSGCRQRFQADTGHVVSSWPSDCYSGTLKAAYRDWRAAQISRLVRNTAEALRKRAQGVKISAAVFPDYPSCREDLGQDWVEWVSEGWLDFICPMDYTSSAANFETRVIRQMGQVAGRMPMYPGVGVTVPPSLSPDKTIWQLRIAREQDTGGWVLFHLNAGVAEEHLPDLRKGFTAPLDYGTLILAR